MDVKTAVAGTLESSDVMVSYSPSDSDLEIVVESIVVKQRGRLIKSVLEEITSNRGVSKGILTVQDRGALECTLRARVETALDRAGLTL
ncbi:citrate lyase acyl carrier protein [Dethiosulfovibrio salsuginis]|uniref:Citrate lyase subunit gamma (Acyl carrier protein) n=1 Tax=Dethiosulfovibrio salsuginis TaxID=561720 RepID=A0A1X7JVW7_9BACT|nr:citrate lyase acyl carrier protein [Dethiosulfovibrio salsuginis]SMG31855.1 citrate lyase subunit gamma (acyl carrier protein) [Dethiosulfovibrio salsuginis]